MNGHWLIIAIVLACAQPAQAQSTEDSNAFDFSLPGARSRGLGGAFVAIADDATSVYSNPAGLTLVFRPEISIEGRHWTYRSLAVDRGHAFGPRTNIGVDTIDGIIDREFSSEVNGVSFLSFIYPRGSWAAGAFFHQLARYEMNRQTQGAFFDCRGGFRGELPREPYCELSIDDGVDRVFPAIQTFKLNIRSAGGALAYSWTDSVSIGVAVQRFDFAIDTSNRVFAARDARKYQPAHYADPDNIEVINTQTGKDHAWGFNAGVKWEIAEHWVAGASFRQGPRFQFHAQTATGLANLGEKGVVFADYPDAPFKVPDTFAAGIAFRPSNAWRVGLEYDRVQFSQLIEDIRNTSTSATDPEGALLASRIRLDDANQLRLGAEYSLAVLSGHLLSFRGGVWYDPLRVPFFEVDDSATGLPAPRWALYFPKREGSVHTSVGLGFATRRHFQVDVAVDLSRPADTFALSSIWRF